MRDAAGSAAAPAGRGSVYPTKWKGQYGYHKTCARPGRIGSAARSASDRLRSPKLGRRCRYWAHQIMAAKNSLVAADARLVEDAFAAKIAILSSGEGEVINAPSSSPETSQPRLPQNPRAAKAGVDKSLLALPEPRRFRDKTHCKFVAKQPCLICGRKPSDAHHLRFAQHPALGRKVSDEFVVPLCRGHHREVHRSGDEASWWSKGRIDPIGAARKLWTETQARTPARSKRLARSPAQPPRGGYPPQNF